MPKYSQAILHLEADGGEQHEENQARGHGRCESNYYETFKMAWQPLRAACALMRRRNALGMQLLWFNFSAVHKCVITERMDDNYGRGQGYELKHALIISGVCGTWGSADEDLCPALRQHRHKLRQAGLVFEWWWGVGGGGWRVVLDPPLGPQDLQWGAGRRQGAAVFPLRRCHQGTETLSWTSPQSVTT